MRKTLLAFLILILCASMVVLSVVWLDYGGFWGLVIGAVGFVWGLMGKSLSTAERLGNAYVGALMGLTIGMAGGALFLIVTPELLSMLDRSSAAAP